jgi:hypothetical protein
MRCDGNEALYGVQGDYGLEEDRSRPWHARRLQFRGRRSSRSAQRRPTFSRGALQCVHGGGLYVRVHGEVLSGMQNGVVPLVD